MSKAACTGASTSVFFPEDGDRPLTLALEDARAYCDRCPVSSKCLDVAMKAEQGTGLDLRHGVFGGLTGAQRYSLEKRGQPVDTDPVLLRDGVDSWPAIPDRGDQWGARHTKLARKTIHWLVVNVEEDGGAVPDPLPLSRLLKGVGVKDLRRVYHALEDDRVIVRTPDGYVRARSEDAIRYWLPKHLTPQSSSGTV